MKLKEILDAFPKADDPDRIKRINRHYEQVFVWAPYLAKDFWAGFDCHDEIEEGPDTRLRQYFVSELSWCDDGRKCGVSILTLNNKPVAVCIDADHGEDLKNNTTHYVSEAAATEVRNELLRVFFFKESWKPSFINDEDSVPDSVLGVAAKTQKMLDEFEFDLESDDSSDDDVS
jgi:hypothetical protein